MFLTFYRQFDWVYMGWKSGKKGIVSFSKNSIRGQGRVNDNVLNFHYIFILKSFPEGPV